MRPGHLILVGFLAVVGAKIAKGLLSGWLNINF
jgi:hypothetical protein